MYKNCFFICLALLLSSVTVYAFDSESEQENTKLSKLNVDQVLDDVYALVDAENRELFAERNGELDNLFIELFDDSTPRAKLEQFYTMLFYISKYASIKRDKLFIDRDLTIRLLISSKVFSDPEFPKKISKVFLSRENRKKPFYKVFFNSDRVELNLNMGDGYGISREGMRQQAKALVFYGSFSFRLRKKGDNIEAYKFKDIDIYGAFGSRGFINVDINYVSLKSVLFYKGTSKTLVRAKVSRKEFEINEHTWLLDLVTRFVTDKSEQEIDW